MSSIKGYIGLKEINSKTRRCSVLVRILRIWVQSDMKRDEGLEMILLDKEGDKIQASVSPSLKNKLMPILNEGAVYVITNFQVGENNPPYQSAKIKHHCKIDFSPLTKVAKCDDFVDIDENGFEFILFRDVYTHDNQFVLDVIAEVKKRYDMRIVSNKTRGTARVCDLDLLDADGNELSCTLWEGYVDQLKNFYDRRPINSVEPVRVVLQFVMKTEYQGKPKVTTLKHATRFFINPDINEIKNFILCRGVNPSLGGYTPTNTGISSGSRNINIDEWLNPDSIKTVAEIVNNADLGTYTIKAKMVDLHPFESWYYEACGHANCFSGVDSKKICKKNHTSTTTVLRFRMMVEVTDGVDYTYFTFFDNWALYFLHKSVSELIREKEEAGDKKGIPDPITDLLSLEKECLFRVEVSERFNKRIYTVKSLTEDEEMISRFSSISCAEEIMSKAKDVDNILAVDDKHEEIFEMAEQSSSNSTVNAITPQKRSHDGELSSVDPEKVELQSSSTKVLRNY